jgi:hypothetical protein
MRLEDGTGDIGVGRLGAVLNQRREAARLRPIQADHEIDASVRVEQKVVAGTGVLVLAYSPVVPLGQ